MRVAERVTNLGEPGIGTQDFLPLSKLGRWFCSGPHLAHIPPVMADDPRRNG
jgi:hypothetical protein